MNDFYKYQLLEDEYYYMHKCLLKQERMIKKLAEENKRLVEEKESLQRKWMLGRANARFYCDKEVV